MSLPCSALHDSLLFAPNGAHQVVHVDLTLHPPSYGVELPDGRFRETEAARLRPLGAAPAGAGVTAGSVPAPNAANGHADPNVPAATTTAAAAAAAWQDDDDAFGDFSAAPPAQLAATAAMRVPTPVAVAVPAAGSPRPSTEGTAVGSPQSGGSGELIKRAAFATRSCCHACSIACAPGMPCGCALHVSAHWCSSHH